MRKMWIQYCALGVTFVLLELLWWNFIPLLLVFDMACIILVYCIVTGAHAKALYFGIGVSLAREIMSQSPQGVHVATIIFFLCIGMLLYFYIFTHRQLFSILLFTALLVIVWFFFHLFFNVLRGSGFSFVSSMTLMRPFPHLFLRSVATFIVTITFLMIWFRRETYAAAGWITKKV